MAIYGEFFSINLKGFQIDTIETNGEEGTVKKDYNIICIDNSNEKMRFFEHNFELEEAEYFVYVVNDFINKKKNLAIISQIKKLLHKDFKK